jgi:hypothetical protein
MFCWQSKALMRSCSGTLPGARRLSSSKLSRRRADKLCLFVSSGRWWTSTMPPVSLINQRFFPFSEKATNALRSAGISGLWKPAECSKTDVCESCFRVTSPATIRREHLSILRAIQYYIRNKKPITGAKSVKLLKNGTLKSYPGLPHGMPTTHAAQINADLLEFIKS